MKSFTLQWNDTVGLILFATALFFLFLAITWAVDNLNASVGWHGLASVGWVTTAG